MHLGWYWYLTGRSDTAADYIQDALDHAQYALPVDLHAWALHTLGWALFTRGRWSEAREAYRESRSLFDESEDREGKILVRAHLGVVERWMGNDQVGIDLTEEAVRLARERATPSTKSVALIWAYATSDGRMVSPEQREGLEEALRGCRTNGDLWGTAHALHGLGDLYRESGHYEKSLDRYKQSLAGFRYLRDRWLEAWTLAGMGRSLHGLSQHGKAVSMLSAAIGLFRDLGDQANSVLALLYMGLSLADGRPAAIPPEEPTDKKGDTHRDQLSSEKCAAGAFLLAAFFALREDLDLADLGERSVAHPANLAIITACESRYRAEWEHGQTMSLDAAIEYAMRAGQTP